MFDFLENSLGFPRRNIYIFGRSIGTGPASHLASIKPNSRMLILLSPYTNLKAVASDLVGFLSFFFKDRFNNLKCMETVNFPTIIIHGKKDEIIKASHSSKLFEALKIQQRRLIQPADMTHNYFKLYEDLILPIHRFEKELVSSGHFDGPGRPFPDSICLEVLELYKSTKIFQEEQLLKREKPTSFSSSVKIRNKVNSESKPDRDQTRRRKKRAKKTDPNKKIDIFSENPKQVNPQHFKKKSPPVDVPDDFISRPNYEFPEEKVLGTFGQNRMTGQGPEEYEFGYPKKMGGHHM